MAETIDLVSLSPTPAGSPIKGARADVVDDVLEKKACIVEEIVTELQEWTDRTWLAHLKTRSELMNTVVPLEGSKQSLIRILLESKVCEYSTALLVAKEAYNAVKTALTVCAGILAKAESVKKEKDKEGKAETRLSQQRFLALIRQAAATIFRRTTDDIHAFLSCYANPLMRNFLKSSGEASTDRIMNPAEKEQKACLVNLLGQCDLKIKESIPTHDRPIDCCHIDVQMEFLFRGVAELETNLELMIKLATDIQRLRSKSYEYNFAEDDDSFRAEEYAKEQMAVWRLKPKKDPKRKDNDKMIVPPNKSHWCGLTQETVFLYTWERLAWMHRTNNTRFSPHTMAPCSMCPHPRVTQDMHRRLVAKLQHPAIKSTGGNTLGASWSKIPVLLDSRRYHMLTCKKAVTSSWDCYAGFNIYEFFAALMMLRRFTSDFVIMPAQTHEYIENEVEESKVNESTINALYYGGNPIKYNILAAKILAIVRIHMAHITMIFVCNPGVVLQEPRLRFNGGRQLDMPDETPACCIFTTDSLNCIMGEVKATDMHNWLNKVARKITGKDESFFNSQTCPLISSVPFGRQRDGTTCGFFSMEATSCVGRAVMESGRVPTIKDLKGNFRQYAVDTGLLAVNQESVELLKVELSYVARCYAHPESSSRLFQEDATNVFIQLGGEGTYVVTPDGSTNAESFSKISSHATRIERNETARASRAVHNASGAARAPNPERKKPAGKSPKKEKPKPLAKKSPDSSDSEEGQKPSANSPKKTKPESTAQSGGDEGAGEPTAGGSNALDDSEEDRKSPARNSPKKTRSSATDLDEAEEDRKPPAANLPDKPRPKIVLDGSAPVQSKNRQQTKTEITSVAARQNRENNSTYDAASMDAVTRALTDIGLALIQDHQAQELIRNFIQSQPTQDLIRSQVRRHQVPLANWVASLGIFPPPAAAPPASRQSVGDGAAIVDVVRKRKKRGRKGPPKPDGKIWARCPFCNDHWTEFEDYHSKQMLETYKDDDGRILIKDSVDQKQAPKFRSSTQYMGHRKKVLTCKHSKDRQLPELYQDSRYTKNTPTTNAGEDTYDSSTSDEEEGSGNSSDSSNYSTKKSRKKKKKKKKQARKRLKDSPNQDDEDESSSTDSTPKRKKKQERKKRKSAKKARR